MGSEVVIAKWWNATRRSGSVPGQTKVVFEGDNEVRIEGNHQDGKYKFVLLLVRGPGGAAQRLEVTGISGLRRYFQDRLMKKKNDSTATDDDILMCSTSIARLNVWEGMISENDISTLANCACGNCYVRASSNKLCSRCGSIYYCSKVCQRMHYKHHKGKCATSGCMDKTKLTFRNPDEIAIVVGGLMPTIEKVNCNFARNLYDNTPPGTIITTEVRTRNFSYTYTAGNDTGGAVAIEISNRERCLGLLHHRLGGLDKLLKQPNETETWIATFRKQIACVSGAIALLEATRNSSKNYKTLAKEEATVVLLALRLCLNKKTIALGPSGNP